MRSPRELPEGLVVTPSPFDCISLHVAYCAGGPAKKGARGHPEIVLGGDYQASLKQVSLVDMLGSHLLDHSPRQLVIQRLVWPET